MFKLKPVIDFLNKAWIQFGLFEHGVCIDEQLVPQYGHNSIKQFMRRKPLCYGCKIWMLCSPSGYCYQFDVYCGKIDRNTEGHTDLLLGSNVVLDLLECVANKKAINVQTISLPPINSSNCSKMLTLSGHWNSLWIECNWGLDHFSPKMPHDVILYRPLSYLIRWKH